MHKVDFIKSTSSQSTPPSPRITIILEKLDSSNDQVHIYIHVFVGPEGSLPGSENSANGSGITIQIKPTPNFYRISLRTIFISYSDVSRGLCPLCPPKPSGLRNSHLPMRSTCPAQLFLLNVSTLVVVGEE